MLLVCKGWIIIIFVWPFSNFVSTFYENKNQNIKYTYLVLNILVVYL